MSKPYHLRWGNTLHPAAAGRSQEMKNVPLRSPYPRTQFPDPCSPMSTDEEDDPWAKKTILSIDGGGTRGYSSLLLLQALMDEIKRIDCPVTMSSNSPYPDNVNSGENYQPCHYFDYIAVSGSSSLIAIMLARYRMTVDEAMPEYRRLCAEVLRDEPREERSRLKACLPGKLHARARQKKMHNWLERLYTASLPGEIKGSLKSDPNRCRTLAYDMGFLTKSKTSSLTVHRSYDDPAEALQPPTATHTMKSSSAGEIEWPPPPIVPFDLATFTNPSLEVVKEVVSLAGGQPGSIDLLLSIGGVNVSWQDIGYGCPLNLQDRIDFASLVVDKDVRDVSL